jgi:hypothetical protein
MINHRSARRCLLSAILCTLLLGGCGRPGYQTAPVSGRVTLNGEPLTDATITFQPTGEGKPYPGPGSFGVTDADGRFRLQLIDRKDGAVVGLHGVRIFRYSPRKDEDDDAPRPRDPSLPAQADDGSLRFEVPGTGTDAADFALVSKRSVPPR